MENATIDSLKSQIDDKTNKLKDADSYVQKTHADVIEYQRQVDYHNSRGDQADANIAAGWLNNANSKYTAALSVKKSLQDDLDKLNKDLANAMNNLSPEEKKQVQVDLNNSEANLRDSEAKNAKAITSQKTTLYLVGGAVALVIIVVVIIVWRKKMKKSASA